MQQVTAPAPPADSGRQARRGRWVWRLTGAATVFGLSVATGVWVFVPPHGSPAGINQRALPSRSFVVTSPVTGLNVHSYGAPIRVTAEASGPVKVTETVVFDPASGPPAVTDTDRAGLLTLAAPVCEHSACSVGFTVTVPVGTTVNATSDSGPVSVTGTGATAVDAGGGAVYVTRVSGPLTVNSDSGEVTVNQVTAAATVDSGGGPVNVNGVAGPLKVSSDSGEISATGAPSAVLDSGGGPVYATGISGQLTVTSDSGEVTVAKAGATRIDSGGGPVTATTIDGPLNVTAESGEVQAEGVTGVLTADTGGGSLAAGGLASASATVTTESGDVTLGFTSAPRSVVVSTGGGQATLTVPGGPYAVTADSQGAPSSVSVPVSPAAASSISVSTEDGSLEIGPA